MNKLTMFLTRPLKGNDGGASLLKTYTGQNTGPIGRPEFLANTLTIWVLNFILHVGDGPQLCMDLYVFGMFTLHGSCDNRLGGGRVRLSCDARWQVAGEARDDRWFGAPPPGHGGAGGRTCIPRRMG